MTTTHDYKYNEEASTAQRIVTICSCCGDIRVKYTAEDIDQMDLWTKPPSHFMPTVQERIRKRIRPMHSSEIVLSPRRLD